MRKIKIKQKDVEAALKRARAISDDWQAECLEILLLPKIAKRWQEINGAKLKWHNALRVDRVEGISHKGFQRDDNLAVGESKRWHEYAGYTLTFSEFKDGGKCTWNGIREDYYAHSPGSAWDGVRRETYHQFIEAIRSIAYGHNHPSYWGLLNEAGIEFEYTVKDA